MERCRWESQNFQPLKEVQCLKNNNNYDATFLKNNARRGYQCLAYTKYSLLWNTLHMVAGSWPDKMFVIFLGSPREMSKEYLKIGHNRFFSNYVQSNRIIQYQKIIPCYYVIIYTTNKLIKKLRTRFRVFTHSWFSVWTIWPPRSETENRGGGGQ